MSDKDEIKQQLNETNVHTLMLRQLEHVCLHFYMRGAAPSAMEISFKDAFHFWSMSKLQTEYISAVQAVLETAYKLGYQHGAQFLKDTGAHEQTAQSD